METSIVMTVVRMPTRNMKPKICGQYNFVFIRVDKLQEFSLAKTEAACSLSNAGALVVVVADRAVTHVIEEALPDGGHGKVQLHEDGAEGQQAGGQEQHCGVAGPVRRRDVPRDLVRARGPLLDL